MIIERDGHYVEVTATNWYCRTCEVSEHFGLAPEPAVLLMSVREHFQEAT